MWTVTLALVFTTLEPAVFAAREVHGNAGGRVLMQQKFDPEVINAPVHMAEKDVKTKAEKIQSKAEKIQNKVADLATSPDLGFDKISAKVCFAEYIAMTLFVIIGCGSAMGIAGEPGWVLQVSLTFGLAITSLAYSVGAYSGAQLNCAVTLGLVLKGLVTVAQGLCNFLAQLLGSITASLILMQMIPEAKDKTGGIASNSINEGYTRRNAVVGEATMTFLLMFVVLQTAVDPASADNRTQACIAIGFAVFLAHCVLIPIDGCSINPTRTFGPAVVSSIAYKRSEAMRHMWVFWVGPLAGAALAVLVSNALVNPWSF